MTTKKAAPKTRQIFVGYDYDYDTWSVYDSKQHVKDNNCDLYFTIKVPKFSGTRREPAYIGEFEVELIDEAA